MKKEKKVEEVELVDNMVETFEEEVKEALNKPKDLLEPQEPIIEEEIPEPKKMGVQDLPGVGAATAEKLSLGGFDTLMSVAVATPGELVSATGVTETTARKMIQGARSNMDMGFKSGTDILERRKQVFKIDCGSSNVNTLLGGGFESGCITECFGQYGSSKTQIAHALAVNVINTYPEAVVVFIDTENTFRPERIIQMAKGLGLDPDVALSKVRVARAFNSDHQMLLAEKVEDLITDGEKVKLVIVDSLTAHFRAEFVGRGTLATRQQKLNKHMHTLARTASVHNICVYVTNQVMSKPDQFFGDPTEAIGGHIVAHNSTFRIYLRKGKAGSRVAKLVDSPNLPDGEAAYKVVEEGLIDV